MDQILALALLWAGAAGLLRLLISPVRALWRWGLRGICGFFCLWLLNLAAPVTGLQFPMNAVTAAAAGCLGLPGIALLAALAWG